MISWTCIFDAWEKKVSPKTYSPNKCPKKNPVNYPEISFSDGGWNQPLKIPLSPRPRVWILRDPVAFFISNIPWIVDPRFRDPLEVTSWGKLLGVNFPPIETNMVKLTSFFGMMKFTNWTNQLNQKKWWPSLPGWRCHNSTWCTSRFLYPRLFTAYLMSLKLW